MTFFFIIRKTFLYQTSCCGEVGFGIFQWCLKARFQITPLSSVCLLLTPRHEPLGWLATTVFDWRKNKCLEKLWCLSHPTSPTWWLNYLHRQFVYNHFIIHFCLYLYSLYFCLYFVFSFVRPDFVGSISFWIYSTTTAKIWVSSQNMSDFSKFEWVLTFEWVLKIWVSFKIWASFQVLSEFSNFEWVFKFWVSFQILSEF